MRKLKTLDVGEWLRNPPDIEEMIRAQYRDDKFILDDDGITLQWGPSDYFIDWKRISEPESVIRWLAHICPKEWEHTTPRRIAHFIERVYVYKGWTLHKTLE